MISLLTNSPWSIFVINILDIAIIAFAVYKILEIMRGTRAMPLAKGVGVLLVFSVLSDVLGLSTVNWVLVQLQTMFIVAIPVVFAPELRRALEQLGTGGIFARSRHLSDNDLVAHQVQQICGCMTAASASRTGVLIAVTRENGLKEYIDTGIAIDGILSTSLLRNIFIVNTPLHDGAVIITGDQIRAASCFLPLSENKSIFYEARHPPPRRHRPVGGQRRRRHGRQRRDRRHEHRRARPPALQPQRGSPHPDHDRAFADAGGWLPGTPPEEGVP